MTMMLHGHLTPSCLVSCIWGLSLNPDIIDLSWRTLEAALTAALRHLLHAHLSRS